MYCIYTRNYANWLRVDKVIAMRKGGFLAHPVDQNKLACWNKRRKKVTQFFISQRSGTDVFEV